MKYIINTDALYGGDIYKSMLLMGTNGRGEVIVQKFNLDELEELNGDYINENYGSLQDEAYQKGYDKGYADKTNNDEVGKELAKDIYQKGLDDAWEAARKIVEMPDPPYWGVFNEYKNDLFGKITASEAIAKLKAYEEKQKADDDIKVGDEVRHERGWTAVVTSIDNVGFSVMDYNGEVASYSDISKFTKTGRHFDIPKILEEMRT